MKRATLTSWLTTGTLVPALLLATLAGCRTTADYSQQLPEGAPALIPLGPDEEMPDFGAQWELRDELVEPLEHSIAWTRRTYAKQFFPIAGIDHGRALASLHRFRELLSSTYGPEEFQERIESEFTVYKSAGWNGRGGGVLFTAYCTPILRGSLEEDAIYRHPLYALPPDLVKGRDGAILGWDTAVGRMPYPSRGAIEAGGLLENRGLELVWLADPIDAYVAHVNGSAFVELPDGSMYRLGYAGKNGRTYRSLGKALEDEGRIPKGEASLQSIRAWAAEASEDEVFDYLTRNESFVFFTEITGNPHGSLDVPVTSGRSLATDKTLFPRGAVVFVDASVPEGTSGPEAEFDRFLFDQDTGGAIRTAGRADIYLGIGPDAVARAGRTKSEGQLFYLFLKE